MSQVAMLVATFAAAGGQIASGVASNAAAGRSAKLQEEQAQIALDESNRLADQKSTERRKFLAEQRMAYLASGVDLSGTPGIVQGDTFNEFQMEIDAIRKSGVAQFGLGMKEAGITRATGRAQLVSGFLNAAGTVGAGMYSYTKGLKTTTKLDGTGGLTWRDT
jgi:hypothetical protein